ENADWPKIRSLEGKLADQVNKLQTLVLKKDIHATKTELETLYPSGYGADKSITAENADWPKIRSLEGKLADQIDSLDVAQKDGMYSREIDPDAHADDADWLADRDREKREAVEQAMAKQVKPLRDAGIGEGMTDAELLDTLPQQEVKGGFGTAVLDRYTKTGDPYPNRSRFKAPGEDEIDSPQIRNYEPEVTREELEALPEGGSITVESGDWNPYHKPHWTTDHTVITKRGDKFDLGEPPDEWVHGDEYDREYIEAENWPPYPFRTGYTYDEVVDWLGPDAVGGRTEQEAHEAEMAETLKRTQRVLNQRSRTLKNFPEAHRIPEVEEVIMGTVDLTDSSERDRVRRAIEREKVKAWDAYQRRRSELEEYNRQFSDMRHSTDFGTRAEYREWTRAAQAADRARSQAGDDWATVQAALDHVTSQGEGMRSPSTPWMDEAGLKAQLDDPDMAIGEGIEPISEGIAGRSAVLQYGSDRFIVTGEPEKVSAAVDRLTTGYGDVGPEDVEIRRLDGNPGSLAAQRLDSVHTVTNTDEFGNIFRRPLTPDDYAGMADGMIVDGKQIVIPPSSNGMASPATVREYETIGKMIDGETVDLPNGVSAKTGEVTFDGLTAPVVNPDLPRSPGGDARQTARVAHALDSFKGLTAEDVEPNSAEAIWQDFVEGREEGVQGLAELAATDPGMLWAGMASPPITPNPEPLPDHYQPNSTALELDQLPIGTYFTDAAGYPYVLHKALPKKDGSVEYMIAKPVDSAGQIIDNDPHPHAVKGVGSKAHGPTRRILFHRWPPANVGAVHPDYAEDVDITVDGP
ncbi:MAG TPA: hypothetical protein PLV93_11330, partial [Microthrixaceae bacterium]|nr:hypothetical protein [Microthrixaceae bacterium]